MRFLNSCSCYSLSAERPPLPSSFTTPERRSRSLYRGLTLCASLLAIVAIAGIGLQAAIAARPAPTESGTAFASMLDTRFGQVWFARAGLAAVLAGVTLLAMSRRGQQGRCHRRTSRVGGAAYADASDSRARERSRSGRLPRRRGPRRGRSDVGRRPRVHDFAITRASSDRPAAAASIPAQVLRHGIRGRRIARRHGGRQCLLKSDPSEALQQTRYGHVVVLKSALFLALIGLGYLNRRHLARRARNEARPARERFLRIAALELVLMAAVITATSALMDEPPPRASATASGRS